MGAKKGYKGKVKIGSTVIGGCVEWSVTGATRTMEDDSEFGDEYQTFVPVQVVGGDITISGNYLQDEDVGQQLLMTKFKSGDAITDLKLYLDLDGDLYLTPDSTTTPASYVTVSKEPDYTLGKNGIGKFSVTFKVSGILKPNTTSASAAVETVGDIDVADTTATLLGELTGLGASADADCYFEYGTTTSYGSDTSANKTTLTAVGLFDNDLTGLSTETTYHYRAVAELDDASKVYGADKTFTTTA